MADRIVRVVMRGDVTGLKAAMAQGAKAVEVSAAKMTEAQRAAQRQQRALDREQRAAQLTAIHDAEKYRGSIKTLGTEAGAVGLVAAAGLGYAIKSAADFNAEMALVRTLSHAGASDMDKLSHAALAVGQNIGYTAKQVAAGEEELIKAGVSVKDILGGGLKGALDLAAAGQTDVATATSIAAAALTEFQLKGKDVPHVADLLAAGADKALGSVEDLGYGLSQAGTTAHQMGISIEDTVGTLAAFAQAGLLGEKGGTTFKMMLLRLSDPAKKAQQTMDELGISLYTASGRIKTMPELADNLSRSLGNLTPKQRAAALGTIFGSRAIQGANILMAEGAKGIQDWITKVNDQGFAAQQAGGKLDSLSGDVKKLGAALQTAFIGVGSGDQSPLRKLAQDATAATNAFNSMPAPVKALTSDMLLITAITGGGLWFGSKVIRGIWDTRDALAGLKVEAGTTRAALSGVGKGFELVAILQGLSVLDDALQKVNHTNVDTRSLSKDLENLGETGHVSGTLLKTFSDDLSGFGKQASVATSTFPKISDKLFGWLPGSTDVDNATKNFKKLDDALSSMVTSGHADEAASAYDDLAAGAKKYGVSATDLAKLFPAYTDELAKNSGAAQLVGDAMTGLLVPTGKVGGAMGALGAAATNSAADIEAQAKALEASRKAANSTAHEFFGLGKSVNDSKVSLHDWISDLEKQAKALRDFTKNAQTAGKKGLKEGLIAELEAAGPEGALRMKQLADASETEIRRANRAWRSGQKAIDKYTNVVGGVPPIVATDLVVNGVPVALSAVSELKRLLDSLHNRNIHVKVTGSTNATVAEAAANNGHPHADGGTIPHAAAGWTVAGQRQPYRDKVLAYLAPGEEVITNRHGEADRFRADRATGRIPAYAAGMSQPVRTLVSVAGGTRSGSPSGTVRFSDQEIDRIAGALLAARPLHGPVHINGDPTVYRREMQTARRRSSSDGYRRVS